MIMTNIWRTVQNFMECGNLPVPRPPVYLHSSIVRISIHTPPLGCMIYKAAYRNVKSLKMIFMTRFRALSLYEAVK